MTFGGNTGIKIEEGGVKVIYDLALLSEKMQVGGRRGLAKASRGVVKIAKEGIKNPPKTGIHHKGLPNRSSAVGEYPARQSGNLESKMGYITQGNSRAFVGNRASYAGYLENGTKRIGRRPFLSMAMTANAQKGYEDISNEINKEIRK